MKINKNKIPTNRPLHLIEQKEGKQKNKRRSPKTNPKAMEKSQKRQNKLKRRKN